MKGWLVGTAAISTAVAITFSAYGAEQLPAPSWVKWDYQEDTLVAAFETLEESEGEYLLEVQKDGVNFDDIHTWSNTWGYELIGQDINDSGSYTFRVKAVGDGEIYSDSNWSQWSAPYVYVRPELEFGPVRNVRWSQEETGTLLWDPPASIPEEYKDSLYYQTSVYRDGQRIVSGTAHKTSKSFLDIIMKEEGTYTVSIRALSKDMESIAHGSKWTYSTEYIDTVEISQEIQGQLDNLIDSLDNDIASPSDATASNADKIESHLKDMDMDRLAIAVQSNENALDTLQYIENQYLDITGKQVKKEIDGVELDKNQIELIGAGLNILNGEDSLTFCLKKPDKEANLDKSLYRNAVQFDINLKGGRNQLIAPVTIIMPIPETIDPDRLIILHYHDDGTYNTIWPILLDDNRVKFTVTDFSLFVFAEPELGQGESEDNTGENTDNNNTSDSRFSNTGKGVIRNGLQGTWISNATGWWYRNADGTWPANCWIQLEWNGIKNWYHFNEMGYMVSGWFTDKDGNTYFLHNIADGNQGYMYTGWHQIDGKWYYFETESGNLQGHLYRNTVTPDGYKVDKNGVWQN